MARETLPALRLADLAASGVAHRPHLRQPRGTLFAQLLLEAPDPNVNRRKRALAPVAP